MTVLSSLDATGRRRSPATLPGYHAGRPPRNKGMRYPADPPTVEEIVAVMRHAADDRHGWRLRATIVVLWRAGLRIQEALALAEPDLDHRRGSLLVRNGKGGRRREVGMDQWGWEQLRPWLNARAELPAGSLFCVIDGPTRGRPWSGAAVRSEFRRLAARAGVRRRFAPHQLPTRTRSSSPVRASRSTSSSASSATPISAPRRSTCRGSTPRRSSRPCAPAVRR
jgi:site-specific recombinase XerC